MAIPFDTEHATLLKLGQSWSRQIDCITHDLHTPMFCVRVSLSMIEDLLSNMEKKLFSEDSVKEDFKQINEKFMPDIHKFLNSITDFLKLLHPWNQKILNVSENLPSFEIKTAVENVLKAYPFENDIQRALVQFDCKTNFKVNVDPLFIEQGVYLILRNALENSQPNQDGNVTLWTEEVEDFYKLYIKNTAKSMTDDKIAYALNYFFSKGDMKKGIDLAYCRLALLQSGGDLIGESVVDGFTQFVMIFPKLASIEKIDNLCLT